MLILVSYMNMENILIYLSSLPLSLSFLNAWHVVYMCLGGGADG